MLQRRFRSIALVGALLSVAACGGDSATGSSDPKVTGTYNLITLNGAALPATVYQGSDGTVRATRGTMVLRSDMSYTDTVEYQASPTNAAPYTDRSSEDGTYTVNGQTVQFTVPADGGFPGLSYQGTVSGNTLSFTARGLTFVYRK